MKLAAYLSRVIALRVLAAAGVLLALGLSLDLIRAADELIAVGGAGALLHYAALRAPALGAQILPLGVLIGALTAFLALARSSELTVMRAAGQSVFRLLLKLVPLAAALGILQYLLIDEGSAWSERALAARFAGIAETPVASEGARVTGRVGSTVIIGELAGDGGDRLAPLTVYALDAEGQVTGRLEAATATYRDGAWHLGQPRRLGEVPPSPSPDLLWSTPLDPGTARALASGAATATAREASAALSGMVVATRSTAYYQTRLARAWSALVIPGVMLLCAAFASFKGARGPGGLGLSVTGALLGMGFVVVDGLFGSFGQVGLIAAWMAAWVPAILFAVAAIWVLLLYEE